MELQEWITWRDIPPLEVPDTVYFDYYREAGGTKGIEEFIPAFKNLRNQTLVVMNKNHIPVGINIDTAYKRMKTYYEEKFDLFDNETHTKEGEEI